MPTIRYQLTDVERAIYRRYAKLALPRHTSYPIAPAWSDEYRSDEFRDDLAQVVGPLSLYVHLPFCEKLCYYCACTKEIIPAARRREHDPAEDVIAGLELEVPRVAMALPTRDAQQVHLGGGSPTFFTSPQLTRVMTLLRDNFAIGKDAELAVEIDPRITSHEQLATLRDLGFNRISMGIQDFSPRVQDAVNRKQPYECVERAVAWSRELGFASLNFDLIYGLPFQTLESMNDTLDKTIHLSPDRIAFYRLAVIPEIFRWQNVFKPTDLPAGDLPLDLNLLAIRRLNDAGYEFLGLDHFAKPTEGLAQAQRDKTMQRNFQGMTTGKTCELIGFGPSAISQLDRAFAQSWKSSADWRRALDTGLATERGLRLSHDDRLRRELMQQLYGYGEIAKASLESRFDIVFDDYFADELERLDVLVKEGIAMIDGDAVRVTAPLGRLLVRVVAAVFDCYLPGDAYVNGLAANEASKVG